MAQVTRVNGSLKSGQQVGRNFEYFTVAKTAVTTAEAEAIVVTLREHGSVEIVGALPADANGTAGTFRVAMSGTNRTAAELEAFVAASGVTGATVTAFVF
jgi:hypothetical protein